MTKTYYAPHSIFSARRQGVYLLAIPGDYWKIGIAFDVFERVKQLQPGCPEKIEIRCFWDTEADSIPASRMEKAIHRKLLPYRTHGEWFNVSSSLLSSCLKEVWFQFRYPHIYERLERRRSFGRTWYRRQAKKGNGK